MPSQTEVVVADPGESHMGRWVLSSLLDLVTAKKGSEETRRALTREIRGNAEAFAGPTPTKVEAALGETAALALFALRTYERQHAAREEAGGMSFAQARYYLKKIEHAQRRFESALRTLATVRRLAIPSVQVNVARNQVVAGNVGTIG